MSEQIRPEVADMLAKLAAGALSKAELSAIASATRRNQQTGALKADWGTPREVVEFVREVLGAIDLDPATSAYWNHWSVKATTFYDENTNGLAQRWRGRVILNPPGTLDGDDGSAPLKFWKKLVRHYLDGDVTSAVFVGFSIEQLCVLQSAGNDALPSPLKYLTLVPGGRFRFLERTEGNGPPKIGKAPMHGNFVTLLHDRSRGTVGREQAARFVRAANGGDARIRGDLVQPVVLR